MTARIEITNINEVLAGLEKTNNKIVEATKYAIGVTGLAVERDAKKNASNGVRRRVGSRIEPPRHIGPSGSGPNVITGNLRRSIKTTVVGFGNTYAAEVSAGAIYARAVEKGLPEWNGVNYPYLEPAATKLRDNGSLRRIFVLNLAQKIRG